VTAMPDQATSLRRLVGNGAVSPATGTANAAISILAPTSEPRGPAARRTNVLAITSGKGGVGKSNVAVNLATLLAASGKRVLLIDADLGLANADVLCGVEAPFNLSHVVSRRKSLAETIVRTPAGFDLVGGASGLPRMADLDDSGRRLLVEQLVRLEHSSEVILVDTGAGISSNVLSFCRAADHVLVVTTPEPTAVTDAYAMVKAISADKLPSRKLSLLVNQVSGAAEGRAVYDRVAKVARQFLSINLLDAGFVVSDDNVTRAVRRRKPLVLASPDSPASRCLMHLAMRLEQGVVPDNSGGFFKRLLKRMSGRG
jgi:flagellar biosynthesis protein FlhG